MNILLTGGLGYIGSHTAQALANLGHNVTIIDNLKNSNISILSKIQDISKSAINLTICDVRDTKRVQSILVEHQIEAVIHFAGLKSVEESMQDPLAYYGTNIQGLISLLEAIESANITTLVFSSSATVYGAAKYLPIDELHVKNTTNPYGNSKAQAEEILLDLSTSSKKWKFVCLRYFNPVGAHESGIIGESPNQRATNIMPHIIQAALGQTSHLNIYGNDYDTNDGTTIRDFIHVVDLAEGHIKALEFLEKNNGFHTFNLGTGEGTSVLELVCEFETANSVKVPYKFTKRRPGDTPISIADPTKARNLLNWRHSRTIKDICTTAWNHTQKNYSQQKV